MSKRETPITRWYWQQLGGLLVEEFCLVDRGTGRGGRWVDALILPERETRIAARGELLQIAPGERAVLVQTKAARLGMYLMGQTLFSADLLRGRYPEAAIESVALCIRDDEKLRPLLEAHPGCTVVVRHTGRTTPAARRSPHTSGRVLQRRRAPIVPFLPFREPEGTTIGPIESSAWIAHRTALRSFREASRIFVFVRDRRHRRQQRRVA
jgi:hypothetical protein